MGPKQKLTPEEAEANMIPQLVDALYPVLIPIEQQDCTIQARNHAHIVEVAQAAWRAFVYDGKKDPYRA